jgi:hypothetical protein
VPPKGLGQRHPPMTAWLDENCGADGWAMTALGTRGVLNDALSIYFADATLASAFVARWCIGSQVETAGGVFQVRDDVPEARVGAGPHKTPWGGEIASASGTRDHRWTVMTWAWKPRRRPKCAFSDGYWQGRLL